MREQLLIRQSHDSRIHIMNQRIEEPFRLPEKATLAFISFVLHGLEQQKRLRVIQNVSENLISNGRFCILDYNHFSVQDSPWYVRFGIRTIECETTENFINRDWQTTLSQNGFGDFSQNYYFKNYLRLISCRKNN
jgi:demethylmenaquinone methyltransferase/2-methoxy-6-polyprenyl-1,4-benzoquinol methylase